MRDFYLAAGLFVFLCGCGGERQSVEGIKAGDIASVEVFFGNLPGDQPDVGPFPAEAEDYERLLGLLRGGEREPNPLFWQGLANIRFRTRGGEEVVASLYQTYGALGAYRVGHTYYRGGSDQVFIRTLRECYERVKVKRQAERDAAADQPHE